MLNESFQQSMLVGILGQRLLLVPEFFNKTIISVERTFLTSPHFFVFKMKFVSLRK